MPGRDEAVLLGEVAAFFREAAFFRGAVVFGEGVCFGEAVFRCVALRAVR